MKKLRLVWSLSSLLSVLLFLQGAWAAPIPGDIHPYEVTFYEDYDYTSPIGSWKINPDMRMLRIPKIDKVPSSILLGSRVKIIIFPNTDFSSTVNKLASWTIGSGGEKVNQKYYLLRYFRFVDSSPKTTLKTEIGHPYSFVIHRKDIDDMLGVYLQSGTGGIFEDLRGQFYPLPDDPKQSDIVYKKIPSGKRFQLEFLAGGQSGGMSHGSGYPSVHHLGVTVSDNWGLNLYFPDSRDVASLYDLAKYKVDQISSILLQYKGPFNNRESYLGRVSAPPATDRPRAAAPPSGPDTRYASPTPAQAPTEVKGAAVKRDVVVSPGKTPAPIIPNLSGQWKSSIGLVYDVTQNGSQFEWTVAKLNEKAQGTVQDSAVSASWSGPQGSGSATGQITAVDANGRATQIDWKNGVRFYR